MTLYPACLIYNLTLSFRICSLIVKSSGLSLVPKAFGTSSCILWIYNPATYPVVKKISFFRITNPHSTEGGMTYPADQRHHWLIGSIYPQGRIFNPKQLSTANIKNLFHYGTHFLIIQKGVIAHHTRQAPFFAHLFCISVWTGLSLPILLCFLYSLDL